MLDYYHRFLTTIDSTLLQREALQCALEQRSIRFFDRTVPMPRLTAWCNDRGEHYEYSGQVTPPIPWPPELLRIRHRIESRFCLELPTVLINYYRNGEDYVSYHKDDEEIFGASPVIVSLSCGAARKFSFRNDEDHAHKMNFTLGDGDLLLFNGEHHRAWSHSLLRQSGKKAEDCPARVNFTFRTLPRP